MKDFLKNGFSIVFAFFLFTGCGVAENITESCGGTFEGICDLVFGEDKETDTLEERIERIEAQLTQLELMIRSNEQTIELLEMLGEDIAPLQETTEELIEQVAILEGYQNITLFIDPCGDGPGFDEVLLRTSQGDLLAYFESGNKRFLTVLVEGTYRTTDKQRCRFRVDNLRNVIEL